MRLCDYVTFSCRKPILQGFQHDGSDGFGFFESLTMHEDLLQEKIDHGYEALLQWRRSWQKLDEDEMQVLRTLYVSIGSNEWTNEIGERPFYETQMDRKRFHRLLRYALLDAFNGIRELVQRAEKVWSASKELGTSQEELENMFNEQGKLVDVVASRIYTLDDFVRTFNKFLKYHLQWMEKRLEEMGKLPKNMGSWLAWTDAAKDYLLHLTRHYNTLDVLSPLGDLRHIVPSLGIQTVRFAFKQRENSMPSSGSAPFLDDPFFKFTNGQKKIVGKYLLDHDITIHAQENTTSQPSAHHAIHLLGLYKNSLEQPLPQPLSHLSEYKGDIFKSTTGCCQSCNSLISQIVKEQGEKPQMRGDRTRFHVLRGWQGERGWKPVMLPSFFPRKYGEPMLLEAKKKLLERLRRIDRMESSSHLD